MNSFARNMTTTFGKRAENIAPILKDMPVVSFGSYVHPKAKLYESEHKMDQTKVNRYMFVGLGNFDLPQTRHSVGMQVVDKIAKCMNVSFIRDKQCSGCVGMTKIDGIEFVFLKPKMPMNVNGTSVARTAKMFDVPPSQIYLIHDDIDSQLGKLCLKEKGSANGHNGVRSVMHSLHTEEIPRVKIGIDRPASRDEVGDYVLQNFPPTEQSIINNEVILKSLCRVCQHLTDKQNEEAANVLQQYLDKHEESKRKDST